MSDRHYVHHEDEVALAKILKESRPWLDKHGTTLIYGLAAVLAVAAIVVYFARQAPATASESHGLMMAETAEDYQAVADEVPDSPIGSVARLRQAELTLSTALRNLFTNRATGIEELDKAATTFELLAKRKDLSDDLRERVLAGMARVLEARCDGGDETTKAAVDAWEKLLKEFPDSKKFKDIAESRVSKLKLDSTKSFYAWFQQQDPKPEDDFQLPQDGPGSVPDIPQINIPDLTSPLMPELSAPTKGTEPPAEGTPAPAEGTPAPAEGTPAPAEGTLAPAEGTPAPAEGTPAPAEGTPAPAEGTPAPAEGTPASAEETPAPAEGTPAPAEETPASEKSGE